MAAITIGRQFGAGGEKVGRVVADRLGWEYLDSNIIDEVARRLRLGRDVVEAYDEKRGSLLDRLLRQLATVDLSTPQDVAAWTPPYSDPAFDLSRSVLRLTQEVIKQAAEAAKSLDPKKVADQIKSGQKFNTVIGEISYDKKGDVTRLDYVMYVWKKNPEGYRLSVDPGGIRIEASSSQGAFYGIQTLRQLLPPEIFRAAKVENVAWQIPSVSIEDVPRFGWRTR